MSASSMKLARWVPWLLLFWAQGVAFAQSQEDSTFNGIDYYAGRIARGFGGGFDQWITEKEQGAQSFRTVPFVYGSLSNRFSLRLSDITYWARYENDFPGQSDLEKFHHIPRVEIMSRLTAGLFIGGGGTFTRDTRKGPQNFETKSKADTYTLRGLYSSRGGNTSLTPEQLIYAYFAEPYHLGNICYLS